MTDRFGDVLNPVVDSSGNTISGAQLFFYEVGTSTKKNTYSDSAKTLLNANPVVADSAGRFGDIFMLTDAQYKVVLAPASDTDPPTSPIDTWDNFSPIRGSITADTPVVSKSANFTVLTTQKGSLFEVDASSGSVNATLPAAADATNGFEITVKKIDSSSNAVTVDGSGSETIDGATTQTLSNQYDSIIIVCDGTEWHVKAENDASASDPLPLNYKQGLQVQINSSDTDHDIDIAAGECRDSADGVNISLSSALVKQLDASWVAGTNQGGLSSSLTLSADTTYYTHAIVVAGASDIGIDTSATAANLVADHSATAYRRLNQIETDSSANIARVQSFGGIVQTVNFETGAVSTGTTVLPSDDTIPQNTEGDEYMTVDITPTNANNTLIVEVVWIGGNSAVQQFGVALFKDSTANALAAAFQRIDTADTPITVGFRHKIVAGGTSAQTFRVRAGGQNAGTTTFNGVSGARIYGGVMASSITITEIAG